jgi:hypothetical protein
MMDAVISWVAAGSLKRAALVQAACGWVCYWSFQAAFQAADAWRIRAAPRRFQAAFCLGANAGAKGSDCSLSLMRRVWF